MYIMVFIIIIVQANCIGMGCSHKLHGSYHLFFLLLKVDISLHDNHVCRNANSELTERSLGVDKISECGAIPGQAMVGQHHRASCRPW